MKFPIPINIDAAISELNGIDALLTAKEWERAAIVYSFTTEDIGGGPRTGSSSYQLSIREFAELGIQGLTSRTAVTAHRDNWKYAKEKGWTKGEAAPGQEVTITVPKGEKYPPTGQGRGIADWVRKDAPAEDKVKAIKQLMQEPEVEQGMEPTIVEMVGKSPALTSKARRVYEEYHPVPEPEERTQGPLDLAAYMGLGGHAYMTIQRQQQDVVDAVKFIHDRGSELTHGQVEALQENLLDWEKTRGLIEKYEDMLREALTGESITETARRLMSEG